MKVALFTDATSNPTRHRTAIAAVCFDVTAPQSLVKLFEFGRQITHCDSVTAEHHAAAQGLRKVRSAGAGLWDGELILLTDIELILSPDQVRSPGPLRQAIAEIRQGIRDTEALGWRITLQQIPRILNRSAHRQAHAALTGAVSTQPFPPSPFDLVEQYPFLRFTCDA